MSDTQLDEFTRAYIECALWSSTAYGSPESDKDESFDKSFQDCNYDTFEPETLKRIIADCAKFRADNIEWISFDNLTHFPHRHSTHQQAGHDFWLTRNGHGAGFWDGDWIEPASTKLTESAKSYGEVYLYWTEQGITAQ